MELNKNLQQSTAQNLELDKNLKLKQISLETKITHCPIPVELLSEDNLDIENKFKYGIENFTYKQYPNKNTNISKNIIWDGDYEIKTKAISSFNNEEFDISYL